MNNFFYDEYLYKKDQYNILMDAYKGVSDLSLKICQEVDDNLSVASINTFSYIPVQLIEVSSAKYNLKTLLAEPSLTEALNMDLGETINDRIVSWGKLSNNDKVRILDYSGFSVLLTSFKAISKYKADDFNSFEVINFEAYSSKNQPLIRNVDYVFRDNKIYFLHESNINSDPGREYLVLKNICVDYNKAEKRLGSCLDIYYNKELTKIDYNEAMKAFTSAALGGPTIKNLNNSFDRYGTLSGVRVHDFNTKNQFKKKFWTSGVLNQFDFLIAMPLDLLYHKEKLNYVLTFFKQIKPAYTNFIFAPELFITDSLSIRNADKINLVGSNGNHKFNDRIVVSKDKLNTSGSFGLVDRINCFDYGDNARYDDLTKYDNNSRYADSEQYNAPSLIDSVDVSFVLGGTQGRFEDKIKYKDEESISGNKTIKDSVAVSENKFSYDLSSEIVDSINVIDCSKFLKFDESFCFDSENSVYDTAMEVDENSMIDSIEITLIKKTNPDEMHYVIENNITDISRDTNDRIGRMVQGITLSEKEEISKGSRISKVIKSVGTKLGFLNRVSAYDKINSIDKEMSKSENEIRKEL